MTYKCALILRELSVPCSEAERYGSTQSKSSAKLWERFNYLDGHMPKPIADRIAALKEQKEQLNVRLNTLEAKAKAEERKRETRRKIIVGGVVLAAIKADPSLAGTIKRLVRIGVTKDNDKDVLRDFFA